MLKLFNTMKPCHGGRERLVEGGSPKIKMYKLNIFEFVDNFNKMAG